MNNQLKTYILFSLINVCFCTMMLSQSTQNGLGVLGHSATGPTLTHYLGWDATTGIPLQIRHDANRPIEWHISGFRRLLLNQGLPGQMVDGHTVDLTGFFGVGRFTAPSVYQFPVSRVHTDDGASTDNIYRPMMKDGFLATHGESLFYSGLLEGSAESGIIWARTLGSGNTPAPLRFIYSEDSQTTTVAGDNRWS